MAQLSVYELERQANIERNKKLLQDLGLDRPAFVVKDESAHQKRLLAAKKRKRALVVDSDGEEHAREFEKAPKTLRQSTSHGVEETGGRRRSLRNVDKVVDYKGEQDRSLKEVSASTRTSSMDLSKKASSLGTRVHDPKTYGAVPGIGPGTWWETREACSKDAIHAPWVAGIAPGPKGAYSVAISGGYADDVDLGYAFTYTGSGGRDLKGTANNPKNLRTAPQSKDQGFESNFNRALKGRFPNFGFGLGLSLSFSDQVSAETKKPVRVIRGFKGKCKYAPREGYRYDGLYTVEKAWLEKGLEGFMVCKYAFKRIEGQEPIPERVDEQPTDEQAVDLSE